MAEPSREVFRDQWDLLEPGDYTFEINKASGYRPTRYKYYFGSVLTSILKQAGHLMQITNPKTGEVRRMHNTTELHQFFKWKYNLVWIMVGETAMPQAGTTTDLTDGEFINRFQEQIMADYAGPPWNVCFVDEEEWKALLKSGQWAGNATI